jgi:hypothetical protein
LREAGPEGIPRASIASITAKSEEVNLPVVGRDVTIGGVTTHYGTPVLVPDTTSGGKWVPYPARTEPAANRAEDRYLKSFEDMQGKLLALITPTISLENGRVVGKAVPSFNHDGKAFDPYMNTSDRAAVQQTYMLNDIGAQINLAALQKKSTGRISSPASGTSLSTESEGTALLWRSHIHNLCKSNKRAAKGEATQ